MKNKLFKNVSLALAGLLTLGGIAAISSKGEVEAAHAASYYTITIHPNGGSVPGVGCLETMYYQPSDGKFYDHLHARTGEPTGEMRVNQEEFTAHYREGYTLQGYYSAATGGSIRLNGRSTGSWDYLSLNQGFVDNKPTGNMTVYAHWKARTFNITLDKQSGTGGTSSITATYDAAMPAITVPTRTGYSFDGYYDATSGGTKYYNANGSSARTWNKAPDITISLYARWTAATYTVTFDHQGGTSSLTTKTVTYNAAMPKLSSSELPKKTAHRFEGYYDDAEAGTKYYNANGTSARTWNKASGAKLYAHWTLLSFTVTLDQQHGTGGLDSVTAIYGQDMPTIEQTNLPTREGATFGGYFAQTKGQGKQYYSDSGTSVNTWDKESAATIYAYWIPGAEAQAVIDLINNIGTVSYPGSNDDITAARNAYNSLSDALKSIVDDYNYATLTAAETQYEALKQAGANNVKNLIDAIGEVSYPESGSKIDAARTGYEALTEEQKALVPNLATLEAAEAEYVALRDAQIQAVVDEINNLPEITTANFVSDKPVVVSARDHYNALTEEQKGLFDADVLASLVAKEELIATYEGEKAAGLAVKDLINAIGEVSYPESGSKIEAARTGYDALKNEHERSYVDNLATLEAAEAEYAAQRDAQIQAVVDEINNLPEITTSNFVTDKPVVESARASYEALTEEQKGLFDADVLASLVAKEELIALYEGEKAAGLAVKDLIDAIGDIGEVSYPGSKDAIEGARAAYNDLKNEHERSYVDNLDVLVAAEARLEELKVEGANAVKDLIDAIGEVEYTEASKDKIDAARAAYDDLTEEQKALVTNYATLTAAESVYNHVDQVVIKINSIGTVTLDSGSAINSARTAYNDLTEQEKALVPNLATLEAAEVRYAELVEAKAQADAVMAKIEAIGEVSYPESGSKIEDARTSYDALNSDGKSFVTNLAVLEAAEAEYLADRDAQIQAVKDEINALPEITTSNFVSDKQLVVSAREHYNALTEEQKGLFDADVLASLVAKEELIATYEGEKAAGLAVKDLIDAIGEVSYPESGSKIEDARAAYDALKNEHERSYVDNLDVLLAAEDRYEELKVEGANAVKDLIDSIGNVEYSEESKDKIDAARAAYDALTEEQKALISKEELQVLVNAETEYSKIQNNANILVITLLVVACLTIVGGIWFLFFLLKKNRKDDDNDGSNSNGKGKPVKAMSVGGLLPGVILVSHYFDAPYIALYVLAGVAVLLWISILVVAIMKKKQVGPFKKKAEVAKVEPQAAATQNEDEEEVETITDEKGNIFQIRFIKSFTAKLIQSPEETKKYYEELKNEVLSYKNTKSRISWHFDSINSGRNYVVKFAIRGKTLGIYFPLNADNYADSKYKVEKVESKKYEDVPCLYRIKNDRRRDYAKELIAVVASNLGLEKGEEQHEVYSNLPYEPNKPLIARGLIKEQKVQINKQAEVVLETKVDEEGDETITTLDNKGNKYEIRYLKSFTAKLSQTDDEIKDFYNELKNYALSYNGSSSRVSWHYDSINVGREQALKFVLKRKNLAIYYALDTSKVGQKYKVEHVEYKKYEDVPCMYLIINEKRKELAKELIDRVMRKYKCEKGNELNDDYRVPFESKEALLKKGLIKEVKTKI